MATARAADVPAVEHFEFSEELPVEQSRREEAIALHPVDRGWHAWLFVVCASGLELCVWGFPFWLEMHSPSQMQRCCLINGTEAMGFSRTGISPMISRGLPKVNATTK